jgi:hypothetical protein
MIGHERLLEIEIVPSLIRLENSIIARRVSSFPLAAGGAIPMVAPPCGSAAFGFEGTGCGSSNGR